MAKKTHKAWTDREQNRLVTMHENKLPIKEIAKALGRTPSSVNNRLAKIKAPSSLEFTPNEKQRKKLFARLFGLWRYGK